MYAEPQVIQINTLEVISNASQKSSSPGEVNPDLTAEQLLNAPQIKELSAVQLLDRLPQSLKVGSPTDDTATRSNVISEIHEM